MNPTPPPGEQVVLRAQILAFFGALKDGGADPQQVVEALRSLLPRPTLTPAEKRMSDPKQDEVPLPQPTVRCGEYAGPPGEGASESLWDSDALIAYGNARARAATERAAQVCRERGGRLQWLADCRRESDACTDAILADAGIKGDDRG
jgi:hypothetical protein